jgi:hypothetical protein
MAKAREAKHSEETAKAAREVGAELKRGGATMPEHQAQSGPTHSPSIEKDSIHARGRVRDKAQEQGSGQPEGVHITKKSYKAALEAGADKTQQASAETGTKQQMSWQEKLEAQGVKSSEIPQKAPERASAYKAALESGQSKQQEQKEHVKEPEKHLSYQDKLKAERGKDKGKQKEAEPENEQ